jgi:hypothetical protein
MVSPRPIDNVNVRVGTGICSLHNWFKCVALCYAGSELVLQIGVEDFLCKVPLHSWVLLCFTDVCWSTRAVVMGHRGL